MQIIYLELTKFLRSLGADHPRTGLERWLLYFCNEEGERMEKVMMEDSVLSKVKDIELSFWADEKEREIYFQHQQLLMDTYSAEHTHEFLLRQERERAEKAERGKEKAAQDALEQGIEKGIEKGRFEIAQRMLARKMSIGEIVDLTGLDEKEILAIR
jgi:predicted transposase/invertase (TIGR01784 family)